MELRPPCDPPARVTPDSETGGAGASEFNLCPVNEPMYFPNGVARTLAQSSGGHDILQLVSNARKTLFLTLTANALHLWSTRVSLAWGILVMESPVKANILSISLLFSSPPSIVHVYLSKATVSTFLFTGKALRVEVLSSRCSLPLRNCVAASSAHFFIK